jgi:hypothetical protein
MHETCSDDVELDVRRHEVRVLSRYVMIAPSSRTTPLESCVADARRSSPRWHAGILLVFVDLDCTDLDHILDDCQFHPYSLTRETLAAEVKSSAESQFVLDTSIPGLYVQDTLVSWFNSMRSICPNIHFSLNHSLHVRLHLAVFSMSLRLEMGHRHSTRLR